MISNNKFHSIYYINVKLIPMRALESDTVEWIKIPETKNSTTFVVHSDLPHSYISVAVKRTLLIYEVTRRQYRYNFFREIHSPSNIQILNAHQYMIAIGTCSNFHVYNLLNRDAPPLCELSNESTSIVYK